MELKKIGMTLEEMKEKAIAQVKNANKDANPPITNLEVGEVYENIMDGMLLRVYFQNSSGEQDYNHVHFGRDQTRLYRFSSEVLNAVSNYKERLWFFRFLEFAGVGGLIAFMLVIIFSVLLFVLAFSTTNPNEKSSVVEVVKLSFTVILGYFFGSQANK